MIEIDLNADLGEGYGPWRMGDHAALLGVLSSANVACGLTRATRPSWTAPCARLWPVAPM